mmetsp:Transcript_68303/g.177390  ORF Transcript_68303/g.177390 Transcript_68303/m.177390 type:complete len:525 (-) Transcript_68303:395-1969(-)|eukprot:CAMPEP_0183388584 /NCGR_PEP_ID=MMETSP0370-20130417/4197_1 /TAXON_ID=268820 /ORGANISM="Peridinium aciculiferum, Strain PAER-2" /LENGTH=524 /DNA_ID=CAMNT_0025567559 /DNA_START=64 /DNA_END=1638 /DNA_ORIENTATION=-
MASPSSGSNGSGDADSWGWGPASSGSENASNDSAGATDSSWGAGDGAGDSWGSSDDDSGTFVMPGLTLGGNDAETINKAAIVIVSVVIGCTIIGLLSDKFIFRKKFKGPAFQRPRGWVIGTLVASYMLLLPGLTCILFAFKLADLNGAQTIKDKQENMLEFAKELWEEGSYFGTACVVGFAMVIPVLKLVMLCVGGILRHSDNEGRVEIARRSIHWVQIVSKWASPDMFAYILLLYLIRKLNNPPELNGLMQLDIGFICFATFCVFSTISSLGVRTPVKRVEDRKQQKAYVGLALGIAIVTTIIFWLCFVVGLTQPSMALKLNFDLLVESGQLPAYMLPIIEALGIAEKAKDDVCLWECIWQLWMWAFPKDAPIELASFIAFFMFAVFVILFTVIDMITLLVTAIMLQFSTTRPAMALEITHVFRKLSMLDVAVVGVIVIILAGKIYEKMGVMLSISSGLYYLMAAEACHYVLHYTVIFIAGKLPGHEYEKQDSMQSEETSESESALAESVSEFEEVDNSSRDE